MAKELTELESVDAASTAPEQGVLLIPAAVATVAGALLVVALLLGWWGLPDALVDPPADAPEDIQFMAEAYSSAPRPEIDAFDFYETKDVLWLVTGIGAFGFGLASLLGVHVPRLIGAAIGLAALVSFILAFGELISPPDLLETQEARGASPSPVEFDLPFSRQAGIWVAVLACGGACVALALQLRPRAGHNTRSLSSVARPDGC